MSFDIILAPEAVEDLKRMFGLPFVLRWKRI
jgi:hypothetical protein